MRFVCGVVTAWAVAWPGAMARAGASSSSLGVDRQPLAAAAAAAPSKTSNIQVGQGDGGDNDPTRPRVLVLPVVVDATAAVTPRNTAAAAAAAAFDPRNFTADRWLPGFHFVPYPFDWLNDPNGPFYDPVHGMYHLFYQYQVQYISVGSARMHLRRVVSPYNCCRSKRGSCSLIPFTDETLFFSRVPPPF